MTRHDSYTYVLAVAVGVILAILAIVIFTEPAHATSRPAAESAYPTARHGLASASRPSTAAPLSHSAAPLHAPSRFHRVYPPETQHARDWAWRGLGDTEFACLDAIGHYESGWRVRAGTPMGSYGIFQAYPASKMRRYGADYLTSAMTQTRFGIAYANARYGSPCKAWAAWQRQGWW